MDDGKSTSLVSVVKSAQTLSKLRKDGELLRSEDTRDWAYNREFYRGNQFVFWNRVSNRVERLPEDDGDMPRYKVRLKNNRIKRGVQRWTAQMSKTKPVIFASPNTPDDNDRKAAEMAEGLYEHLWRDLGLTTELQRALLFAALSQGYWLINFDPLAGKPQRHILNPETGAPIDGPLAEMLLESIPDAAKQMGVSEDQVRAQIERVTYEGEISVEARPGETVLIDPTASSHDKAMWAVCTHSLTPDEVKARWNKDVIADAVPTETTSALMMQKTDKRPRNVKQVFIGYFKPQPALPRGRYVVWIEDPMQILFEGDWPFPFNELPLIKFPGHESTTGPLDLPPTTDARPLQKEINRTVSQIVEFKNLTLNPQMLAPVGSLAQRLTREPGAVIEYNPIAGLTPEWKPMPALPRYVFDHLGLITAAMDDVYNAMPNQRDQLPARIDSPGSIDLLQESVADQLLPPIRRLEESLVKAGYLMAMLAQKFYTEERLIKVKGASGSMQAKKFRAADLRGGYSFHAEAGSGLPRTREAKQQRVEFLLGHQLITPQQALKFLDMPDLHGLHARIEADEDHALREHDRLMRGEPLNQQAVEQTLSEIQSMIQGGPVPQGMEPPADPQQFEQWIHQQLMQASLTPLPYENLEVHYNVHREYMTTASFEALPPEIQQAFVTHYQLTTQQLQQIKQAAPTEPPKINLGLKATTSAPVMGELLRRAGINVTDEQVAQLPLETWVTDSMDKPDMDTAGNDPLDDMERLQAMQHTEEQHAATTAKATHDLALAQRHSERADELHEANLRTARARPASG